MSCPKDKIERSAHIRKGYTKSSGIKVAQTYVSATCVPDKGKPGKTPLSAQVLPKLGKELSLTKYGYSTRRPSADRHKALMSASRDNDPLKVLRRLNLIRNYQADEVAKRKMSSDVNYMKNQYAKYKETRKGSKKN